MYNAAIMDRKAMIDFKIKTDVTRIYLYRIIITKANEVITNEEAEYICSNTTCPKVKQLILYNLPHTQNPSLIKVCYKSHERSLTASLHLTFALDLG